MNRHRDLEHWSSDILTELSSAEDESIEYKSSLTPVVGDSGKTIQALCY